VTLLSTVKADRTLDTLGLYCPVPILRTREEIDKMTIGQILEIVADDPAAEEDLKRFAKRVGHEVVSIQNEGNILRIFLKKTR
jgi:TusA-related sulfurtransferase